MIDRKNVIDNLEQNIRWIEEIECHQFPGCGNVTMAMRDAVELLKEQEPAEAKTMGESKSHGSWWFACGSCGHAIDPEDNFCRECGRKIKWDD